MAYLTRDGSAWTPEFLTMIDGAKCIGCGRCYKVCSREVMHLHGVDDSGMVLGRVTEDDDDDFDGELNRKIMIVDNSGACVGCGACARVCPKDCQTHVAADRIAA
jgi:Nif-specific ferredoxin III